MLLYCRELLFNKKPMGALYIYPIFLNLTIECGQTNLEQPGSLCLVAMRMVKHLDDVVALHTLQVKGVIGSRGCVARKHVYGQVMTVISSSHTMRACSMAFIISRTLPGHG